MPHPNHLAQPQRSWRLAILEVCPPGEGLVWLRQPHQSAVSLAMVMGESPPAL